MARFQILATKEMEVALTIEADTRDEVQLKLDALDALNSSKDWEDKHLSMTIHEIMAKEDDVIFLSCSFDLQEDDNGRAKQSPHYET
jgi:hypothetical protein